MGGSGGKTTSGGLKKQGDEIAGDELLVLLLACVYERERGGRTMRVYASGLILEFSGPKA
jgi:hypothetical protein